MATICVFCGSLDGTSKAYGEAAIGVGKALAQANATLCYGGGTTGLMALANRERQWATTAYTEVPEALTAPVEADRAGPEDRSLITVVDTMHERKLLMAKLSAGFIVLPGGFGTLEELAEMTTWTHLGIHAKPVVCIDVEGFFAPLKAFVESAVAAGFIPATSQHLLTFLSEPLPGKTLSESAVYLASQGNVNGGYKLKWT